MMKAALTYYRESKTSTKSKKITLGELASSGSAHAGRLSIRRRRSTPEPAAQSQQQEPQQQAAAEMTPAEKSLMRLVQNGQVGMLIAHYAPKVS